MFPGFQQFPEGMIIAFALIFLRCMAFVISWPVFGSQNVSVHIKVLLAIVLAMSIFPTLQFKNSEFLRVTDQLLFLAIRELVLGLVLGFILRFFFFAISISGEMIGISSGLSSAQLFNPMMGTQTNVMEQAYLILATIFFLVMNGHHLFLQGLVESFAIVPIGQITLETKAFTALAVGFREVFMIGIKMASPVVVAIFVTNLTMGLLGRAVPQLNVMTTSFQVTIVMTMTVFFITLPLFVDEMSVLFQLMSERFFTLMRAL